MNSTSMREVLKLCDAVRPTNNEIKLHVLFMHRITNYRMNIFIQILAIIFVCCFDFDLQWSRISV